MAEVNRVRQISLSQSFASKPIWGVLVLVFALFYAIALLDFEPGQSAAVRVGDNMDANLTGAFGASLAFWSRQLLGYAAYGILFILFWFAAVCFSRRIQSVSKWTFVLLLVWIVSLSGLCTFLEACFSQTIHATDSEHVLLTTTLDLAGRQINRGFFNGLGGSVGQIFYNSMLARYIGLVGNVLVLVVFFLSTSLILFSKDAVWLFEKLQLVLAKLPGLKKLIALRSVLGPLKRFSGILMALPHLLSSWVKFKKASDGEPETLAPVEPKKDVISKLATPPPVEPKAKKAPSIKVGGLAIVEQQKTQKAKIKQQVKKGGYRLPPIDFLVSPTDVDSPSQVEDYVQKAERLVQTLAEFNVQVSPSEILTGPVITRYEVTPAPGVRVEKILSLDKNIALSLKAHAVRILAPVPGKGTVGIEVPNEHPKLVCMREIIESKNWVESKAEIPIVLGKDVTGHPVIEDLTRMPHMLIAGATGSGKTVCINAIIASLLYRTSPEDLRFIMVDPKLVEMQVYDKLPHLLVPVVTNPKKVPAALKYLIREMEHRYQIFAKVGVRNIAGFNKQLATTNRERERAEAIEEELSAEMSAAERAAASADVPGDAAALEIPDAKLPYIVCIVDELADLMMVAPQDIETSVARLAQLARAAGIHLILATQRPSVNVITGLIKANLPTRISFGVASKIDSRTILDQQGAEALIGKGDMLYIPPGGSEPMRAQGAFVDDSEINDIVDFIEQNNGSPQFSEDVQRQIDTEDDPSAKAEGEWEDDLVPEALEIIRVHGRASISFLQRKLKIGYNRSARIMETLETEGFIGPDDGSGPREILKNFGD